jgi:hypothetical protein
MADLLILAHGGSWDLRFQISSLAAAGNGCRGRHAILELWRA